MMYYSNYYLILSKIVLLIQCSTSFVVNIIYLDLYRKSYDIKVDKCRVQKLKVKSDIDF